MSHEVKLRFIANVSYRLWQDEPKPRSLLHGETLNFRVTWDVDGDPASGVSRASERINETVRQIIDKNFNGKLLVAKDDPYIDDITHLEQLGVATTIVVIGDLTHERFAKIVFDTIPHFTGRVLRSVACGSAIFQR